MVTGGRPVAGTVSMLKALILDVDGTLYRQKPLRRYLAARFLRYVPGHPVLAWKTLRALRAYRRAQEELRVSRLTGAAHLQAGCAAHRTGYPEDFVRQCVGRWMESAPLPGLLRARYPGVESCCRWAAESGVKLGALSDYDPREKLRALGLHSYFSAAVWAQEPEVGVFKPNPLGLRIALQRLGVLPAEAVYVGDRPEVDAALAVAGGVAGILLSPRRFACPPGVVPAADWFQIRNLVEARWTAAPAPSREVGS